MAADPGDRHLRIAAGVHAVAGVVALAAAVGLWWMLGLARNLDLGGGGPPAHVAATTRASLAPWPVAAVAALGVAALVAAWALHRQRPWAVPLAGATDGAAILVGGLAAWDGFWNLALPLSIPFGAALVALGLPGVRAGQDGSPA